MTERHTIELIMDSSGVVKSLSAVSNGTKKVSADLGKFGTTGAAALGKVRKEAQETSTAVNETNEKLSAAGGIMATWAAGMGIAGQASMTQRRELDLLNRVYGDGAAEIIAHTQAIEDNTNFTNQAARTSAVTAATLATNYGFTAEQITELLSISADLAQVQGRDLADTTQRVTAAMRGEAESAEALGLTLNDAKVATFALEQGMTGYSTSMTDAERAQVRFLYLQEQTATVNGAAADAAVGAAASVADLKGAFFDAAEGVGAFMGPLAPAAAELAGFAGALPEIGVGLGRVADKLKDSALAMKVLAAATGPVAMGLGVVALAAGVAYLAWQQQEDGARSLILAYDDVNKAALANAAITQKAAAGAVQVQGKGFFDQLGEVTGRNLGGDLSAVMGQYTVDGAEATKIAQDQAVALANVTVEADTLTAAQNALNAVINAGGMEADTALKLNANLAQLYAEVGERGEIAEAAVAKLNAQYLNDGDEAAYAAGAQLIVDTLGDVAAKAADATVAVFAFSDAQKTGIMAAADQFLAQADANIATMEEQEAGVVAAANAQADGVIAAAQRQAGEATRLANAQGREAVKAAEDAGTTSVRAAEKTESKTVNAANAARDGKIAAAEAAQVQQVAAAEAAAEGQIAAAEKAEKQTVSAADRAASGQIRAAEKAGQATVRAATVDANKRIAAADRMEESVAEGAKLREEAIVESATRAHDAVVDAAEDAAEREIAAAKRSTEKQLFELERLTAAKARAISAEAGDALQDINDQAAKAIAGGADVGKISNQMARDTAAVYDKQVKDQEALLRKEEAQTLAIQDKEDARVKAANEAKDAATEASAARVKAITESAAKEAAATTEFAAKRAEQIRTDAARDLAQVEREVAREVGNVTKAAAKEAARITVAAANRTKAITESANAGVDAVKESASANTDAVTDQATAEAAKVEVEQARLVRQAHVDADRESRVAKREWGAEVKLIARDVARVEKEQIALVETAELASAARVLAQTATLKAEGEAARAQVLSLAATADPVFAEVLRKAGEVSKGADGKITVNLSEDADTMATMQFLNDTFGPNAATLVGTGTVALRADFTQLNADLKMLAASPGSTTIDIIGPGPGEPNGARRPNAPPGGYAHGGVLSAANGRVVTVGERGREDVLLPVGSRIRSNPATEAAHAGGGGVTIQITGDVYGMDDFESKVGLAAAAVLSRSLPAALSDRRRSLGGA